MKRSTLSILFPAALALLITPPASSTTLAALPPGLEDEILCHPAASSCLRPFPRRSGWCGPRTAFVECCDVTTGEVSRPRGWGEKLGSEYKKELLRQGWGVAPRCGAGDAERCGRSEGARSLLVGFAAMEDVVDRLFGLLT